MNPWTSFWKQGHSTAFGDPSEKRYGGDIHHWWLGVLKENHTASTILEVGCGNTSLLPGMIETNIGQHYIGVDLAEVSLNKTTQSALANAAAPKIQLHSNTPAENLPIPANEVDLAASVFGIEYSDETRSFAEVLRVLSPGAGFHGLLHNSDSLISETTRKAISEYDDEVMRIAISSLETIDGALVRCGNNPALLKSEADAEKARIQINDLAVRFLSNNETERNEKMFDFMRGALFYFKSLRRSPAERLKVIAHLETEFNAGRERCQQMLSSGRDESQMAELVEELKALGFSDCAFSPVTTENDALAWQLKCFNGRL
jgi:ubiquinone/menaquinone biosynthesis C-methylase UbiE